MTLCWRVLGDKRHRYAFARPDKVGTGPMADDGIDRRCREKRAREEPVISKRTRFSLAVVNERARLNGTAERVLRNQFLKRARD